MRNAGGKEKDSRLTKEKEKESTNSVPFYRLFAFADSIDYMLMIVGTVGAVANGMC